MRWDTAVVVSADPLTLRFGGDHTDLGAVPAATSGGLPTPTTGVRVLAAETQPGQWTVIALLTGVAPRAAPFPPAPFPPAAPSGGPSPDTPDTPDTPPGPPVGLTAAAGANRLAVAWTAPAAGGPVATYRVEWGTGGSYTSGSATVTGTSHTIAGLTAGTRYNVRVRAQNAGGASAWATTAGTPTATLAAPGSPGAPSATVTDTTAAVAWTAPASGGAVASYELRHRAGQTGAWTTVTGLTGLARTITGLTAGTAYEVEVRAVNATGASAWARGSFTTVAAPDTPDTPDTPSNAPVITGAVSHPGLRVELTWTFTALTTLGAFTAWRIERWSDSMLLGRSTVSGAGTRTVSRFRVTPSTTRLRIRAEYADGNSDYSSFFTITSA